MKRFRLLVACALASLPAWGQAIVPPAQPPYTTNYLYYEKMHWSGNYYLAAQIYNSQDMVNSAGSLYISKQTNNKGHDPATSPTWWDLLPGGARADWITMANAPVFDVRVYGADPTGAASSTAACNAAATAAKAAGHGVVLFPSGTYKMTDACTGTGSITFSGPGVIVVPPTFNLAAVAVFAANYAKDPDCAVNSGLCPGVPSFEDLTIRFQNTEDGVYANLIRFPPAIACGDLYGCSFMKVNNVTTAQAMTGIRITPANVPAAWSSTTTYAAGTFVSSAGISYQSLQNGNFNHPPASSGAYWVFIPIGQEVRLTNIRSGGFDYGIYLNGSDSEVMIDNYHCYPFETAGNQGGVYPLHGMCLYAAALYDLNITNFVASNWYRTLQLNYDATTGRGACPRAVITALTIDSYGGMDISCGGLSIGQLNVAGSDTPQAYYTAVIGQAGTLNINGGTLEYHGVAGTPQLFKFDNNGLLTVTNVNVVLDADVGVGTANLAHTESSGRTTWSNSRIVPYTGGFDFSGLAIFAQESGGIMSLIGNELPPIGTSTHLAFAAYTSDGYQQVVNNIFPGYPTAYPTVRTLGVYQPQLPWPAALPTITGCGTISAQKGTSNGWTTSGEFVTSATSCSPDISNLSVAGNGYYCMMVDVTAATGTTYSSTSNNPSSAGFQPFTTAAGDKLNFVCTGH